MSKELKEVGVDVQVPGGRVFQADGTACGKTLRQECACHVSARSRMPGLIKQSWGGVS